MEQWIFPLDHDTMGQLEGQLDESTARIDADVEVPAGRWRPIDPDPAGSLPDALLFVDGVRRVEAQLWIDGDAQPGDALAGDALAPGAVTGEAPGPAAPQWPAWASSDRTSPTYPRTVCGDTLRFSARYFRNALR